MRLAPTNNLPLERIVPREGLKIDEYQLPGGTNIGTSAYIIHRDTSIYGADAHQFRPERWLESDPSMLRQKHNHFFAVRHEMALLFPSVETDELHGVPVWPRRARLQRPYARNDDDGKIHG